jgi:ATP-binding cassette subfamily C protein CydD
MKPLDPRLLRYAHAARRHVFLTAGLGGLTAALVVAQAWLIAHAVAPVVQGHADWSGVQRWVLLLMGVLAARGLVAWAQERYAVRAANRTIGELRERVVAHAVALGPRWLALGRGPELATLVTRGLDALEPYFVRYLPQLLLAATVTPATLAVVLGLDVISAVLIAGTLPLVPLFMILVGRLTQDTAQRRQVVMQRLGGQVLDLLAGLPTLRALGRENGPGARVRLLGEANRKATLGTLRVAFLSGMVLELLTTLSVALVAVGVGLRLVHGELDLVTGLAVIILAPECYLPLRQVGTHFHASTDGMAAASQAFEVLAIPLPPRGTAPAPSLQGATLAFEALGVRTGQGERFAPAGLTAKLGGPIAPRPGAPGQIIALTGTSGSGKTTAALALLGLLAPDEGRVVVTPQGGAPMELTELAGEGWWSQLIWIPQRPVLPAGTLREAVLTLRGPGSERASSDASLEEAAKLTGLDHVVASLPQGWDTRIGQGGLGLSVGQRQRVALSAGLLGDAQERPLIVLDEPTAHLDADGEQAVLAALERWREQGRTVVVIAHRATLIRMADVVVPVRDGPAGDPATSAARAA